jgi:hypothetical protein
MLCCPPKSWPRIIPLLASDVNDSARFKSYVRQQHLLNCSQLQKNGAQFSARFFGTLHRSI